MEQSVVSTWFSRQNIFVTGATGFVGKVLVEKLLRCCPEIKTINVLVRAKKNKLPQERMDEFLQLPLFDRIREIDEKLLQKIRVIEGDVSESNLALKKEDLTFLQENTTAVFNSAACVRFDQPLREEIKGNTKGTLILLELAKTFKKLKVFVHISTAFCQCDQVYTEERIYESPYDPKEILHMIDWMDEELFSALAPKLLKENPNTYTYSKYLTEALLSDYVQEYPIVLARPSIVCGAWQEPLPGWIDTINGISGFILATATGILHTLHGNPDSFCDSVPVDYVVNALILSAWKKATTEKKHEVFVVNITADKNNRETFAKIFEGGKQMLWDMPFEKVIFYPFGTLKRSYYVNYFTHILLHMIPALLIDLFYRLSGKKPFLYKLQTRIYKGLSQLSYFLSKSWYFEDRNLKEIAATLNSKDRKIFFTNIVDMDWEEYSRNCFMGLKLYILKEKLDNLPRAKRDFVKSYRIYLGTKAILLFFMIFLLYKTVF